MGDVVFKFLPKNTTSLRNKVYSAVYTPSGANLPRKQQLTARSMVTLGPAIEPVWFPPVGTDTHAPMLPGDRLR